eukprot:m.99526 g.99526  ORF g.99526 m.99526 type:complete len:178 (-) comp27166_c2_seq1:3833-4366(-)
MMMMMTVMALLAVNVTVLMSGDQNNNADNNDNNERASPPPSQPPPTPPSQPPLSPPPKILHQYTSIHSRTPTAVFTLGLSQLFSLLQNTLGVCQYQPLSEKPEHLVDPQVGHSRHKMVLSTDLVCPSLSSQSHVVAVEITLGTNDIDDDFVVGVLANFRQPHGEVLKCARSINIVHK